MLQNIFDSLKIKYAVRDMHNFLYQTGSYFWLGVNAVGFLINVIILCLSKSYNASWLLFYLLLFFYLITLLFSFIYIDYTRSSDVADLEKYLKSVSQQKEEQKAKEIIKYLKDSEIISKIKKRKIFAVTLFVLMALDLLILIWYSIAVFSIGWNIFCFLFFFIPDLWMFCFSIIALFPDRIKLSKQVMKAQKQARRHAEIAQRRELETLAWLEYWSAENKAMVRRRELAAKIRQTKEKERQTHYLKIQKYINTITSKCLLIDSNIWMNEKYDILLKVIYSYCKRNHSSILIPCHQLDELDRLTHSDVEEKRILARKALKTIEYFQLNGIIKTAGVQARMQFDSSYADPSFIEFFLKELQINGFSESVFLTDDRALRIRLNAMTIQQHKCLIKVFTGEVLLPVAKEIYEYEKRNEIRRIKREK